MIWNSKIHPRFLHRLFTTCFPAARSFNHSFLPRLASQLELGSQMNSVAETDHFSTRFIIQHTRDLCMMRAEMVGVIEKLSHLITWNWACGIFFQCFGEMFPRTSNKVVFFRVTVGATAIFVHHDLVPLSHPDLSGHNFRWVVDAH